MRVQKRVSKEGVQQEMLSNYYLQKYSSIMTKINPQHSDSPNWHTNPTISNSHNQHHTERINFKNVLLQRKTQLQQSNSSQYKSNQENHRKNFKAEVLQKKKREEENNQEYKTVQRLRESIINELYTPSPSKLQNPKLKEIQMRSINYSSFQKQSNNFNEEFSIVDSPDMHLIERQLESDLFATPQSPNKNDQAKEQVSQKIHQTFQKRKSASPNKNSSFQESDHSRRIERNLKKNEEKMKEEMFESQLKLRESIEGVVDQGHRLIVKASDKYFATNEELDSKEIQQVTKKDEELLEFIPASSQYYKIADPFFETHILGEKIDKELQFSEQNEFLLDRHSSREKSQALELRKQQKSTIKDQSNASIHNAKESAHDMSMMSRFSMSSDEGVNLLEKLQKQLNQSELGPYQSALYNLKELVQQYPNAWPIYVVSQRILDDRAAYETKRITQETILKQLRSKNSQFKKHSVHFNEEPVKKNQQEILRMIRKIATRL